MEDAEELLVSNLETVERTTAFIAHRYHLSPDDAEEFAAIVRLRLVEDNFSILRKYEGRSSLAAYLTVVIQRLLLDHRTHTWGKWHSSAEARRLGPLAVEVEKLMRRDGRTLDEIARALGRHGPEHRQELQAIVEQLPVRAPKRRNVSIDDCPPLEAAEVTGYELRAISIDVSSIVRDFLSKLHPDDRLAMQLRFDSGMTVAEIARSTRTDARRLYRQMESHLRDLRNVLESRGIMADQAKSLIGESGVLLDFGVDEART